VTARGSVTRSGSAGVAGSAWGGSAGVAGDRPFAAFVAVVVVGGVASAGWWFADAPAVLRPATFWTIVALTVLVAAWPLSGPGPISTATAIAPVPFSFALLLGWGPGPAVLAQALAVAVASVRQRHPPWRALFGAGRHAVAYGVAALVLHGGGVPRLVGGVAPSVADVLVLVIAAGLWFLVNECLVTTAVWLRLGDDWVRTLLRTLRREAPSALGLLALGPIIVAVGATSAALLPLTLVPLVTIHEFVRGWLDGRRRSLRDEVTGLPNREAFRRELSGHVRAYGQRSTLVARDRNWMAVLRLDLNQFRRVNDAFGPDLGDRLLAAVGQRLHDRFGRDAFVARLAGDEFALLAPGLADPGAAAALADRVARVLDEPVVLDGVSVDATVGIGVAVLPEHGTDEAALLSHAEVAMYDAKGRGAAYTVYGPELDQASAERLELLADLRTAVRTPGGEIQLLYQPQVALDSGQVVGVEALLRWHHPRHGMVSPDRVTRVAEGSAVMRLLTSRVFDEVVTQMAAWRAAGIDLRTSINVSILDLHRGELVDELAALLTQHGVPPHQVQLEITEGAFPADPRRVLDNLHRLDGLGVRLSLDDFGTGYTSLQQLRRLPLSEVKIDRSFVFGMATDPEDAAVVGAIIDLGNALGLRVVAEGVEDDRTRRMLAIGGCEAAQGWYYARPMAGDALAAWLARHRPVPRTDEHLGLRW
jgi:diguanylate cyclase